MTSTSWIGDPEARARRLEAPAAKRLLEVIGERGSGTVAEVASAARVGPSYAKDILLAAVAAGLVTSAPVSTGLKGRPPMVYRLAPPTERAESTDAPDTLNVHGA